MRWASTVVEKFYNQPQEVIDKVDKKDSSGGIPQSKCSHYSAVIENEMIGISERNL